jgi:hypothetical protein
MKTWLRSWFRCPLFNTALMIAALVELSSLPSAPKSLPPVVHPNGCHACSASTPAVAAARDAYLFRVGAFEADDLPR